MDAIGIYNFHALGIKNRTTPGGSFVPQLSTGSMPSNQGSNVAPVNPAPFVNHQAIPGPLQLPWKTIQNQRYRSAVDPPAPWVAIPACASNNIPKSKGLGLVGFTPLTGANMKVNTAPIRTFWHPEKFVQ